MLRKSSVCVLIALLCCLVVAAVTVIDRTWLPFENRVYDLKYTFRYPRGDTLQPPRPHEQIIIVDVDDASLRELGRYQNWPRAYYARVIDQLRDAAAVGVDIFFGEPDTLPTAARQYYDKPDFDSLIIAALAGRHNVVLVSSFRDQPVFHDLARTGMGEIVPDDDGVVRTGFRVFAGETTFAAAIASIVRPGPLADRFRIDYMEAGSFRRIPFADVYFERIPREFFTGKIVLIGGTARGLFDYRVVPFNRNFPGVEIHANIINNFINGKQVHEIPTFIVFLITFILTLIIGLTVVLFRPRIYIPMTVFIYIALLIISFILFTLKSRSIELGVIRSYYSFTLCLVASLIYRYRIEEKEKRKIRSIFSRYYSRELLDKVLAAPPVLGGERVEGTVIFADIRNFTPFAEKTTPEQVAEKLNRHLTEMVEIVFFYQGRVDKYIGDCVMAVFGTPVRVKNHAINACQAAKNMVKMAAECGFKIGVGVNSGSMISGNFGSPMRMEYTVVGDNVNLAARLESATKDFGVGVIASEATYQMAMRDHPSDLSFRPLGAIKVKGKEEEIKVYEVT